MMRADHAVAGGGNSIINRKNIYLPRGLGISESAHRMIHAGRKRRPNGPGSWVGSPLPVSFFFPSVFCSFLLPPYAHQLPGLGRMVSPSTPMCFSFVLSFLSVFLALLRADPVVAG